RKIKVQRHEHSGTVVPDRRESKRDPATMTPMHVHDLPDRSQDYLKALWDIAELSPGTPAALGDLARLTGQKLPTASEAVKRLARQGLVHHEPYAGVTLTTEGRRLALAMVRRHRL